MPTVILSESAGTDAEFPIIDATTGEMTVEAQVVSDFLTHVDFSAVTGLKAFEGQAEKARLDFGEGEVDVELVPGELVAEATDLDDLCAMFEHYLETLIDEADGDKATLEQKAIATAVIRAFGEPVDEGSKFPTGRGKMRRAWKGNKVMQRKAVGQMIAMRKKQVYVTKNGKNVKGPGYRGGGTRKGKVEVQKFKAKNKSKIARARRMRGLKAEGEAFDVDNVAIFGLAEPYGTGYYEASVRPDAEAAVEEAKKKLPPFMKKGASKPACEADAPPVNLNPLRPSIGEGANLAGQMLSLHEGRGASAQPAAKS